MRTVAIFWSQSSLPVLHPALFEANENSNLASGFVEVSKIATRVGAVLKNCRQLTECYWVSQEAIAR